MLRPTTRHARRPKDSEAAPWAKLAPSSTTQVSHRGSGAQRHAAMLLLSLVWLIAGCAKRPAVLSEGEFRRLRAEGATGRALTTEVELDTARLGELVRLMQDRRLDPVYRGYLWFIAYYNLGTLSPEEARRLWFINYAEIAQAVRRRTSYRGTLKRDDETWRSLQKLTGFRIAVNPHCESLYDGAGENSLEIEGTSSANLMGWSLALSQAFCVVGFGSVFVSLGHGAGADRFSAAYQRYRAGYESGAAPWAAPQD